MAPPGLHPLGVRVGRTLPGARHPYMSIAVPTVIARYPDKARARGRRPCFDNCGRGSYPDNDLRAERAHGQKTSECRTNQ